MLYAVLWKDCVMPDPLADRDQLDTALGLAARGAREYLQGVWDERVVSQDIEVAIGRWSDPMPEEGDGTLAAVQELADRARETATRSSGPRFFHFVMGGGTPAALAADWLTSAYDQVAYAWASSPFAARLEQVAVEWLRELFELPGDFGGVLTTGATMANFVALAAARNRWAERHGVDVEAEGVAGLPVAVILSSGYVHPSAVQAIGMLGLGRANVRRLVKDDVGRLDLGALEHELSNCAGTAIVIANAGEVNAGDFDPIADIADLCERHDAWLHVDGAFGLFARLAPSTRPLTAGVERADSVICDGHKWLNVPYDWRVRVRPGARARAPCAERWRAIPARRRRPAPELRLPLARELASSPRAHGLGDAASVRARRVPADGRATPRARATPRGPYR